MSGHSKWRDIKHKAEARRRAPNLEWMVSMDTSPAAATEKQIYDLVDELEGISTPGDGTLGTTITVWALTREAAADRGRERFEAALRATGVDAKVATIEVGTYDE